MKLFCDFGSHSEPYLEKMKVRGFQNINFVKS